MKLPRVSLATLGFVILVAAIDFAVIRWVYESDSESNVLAMFFLPMIDVFLAVAYRARNRGSLHAASRISFLIAGSIAAAGFLALTIAFPDAIIGFMRIIHRPSARAILNALTRLVGNQAMKSGVMKLTVGIAFDMVLPMVHFSLPPLIIALIGGRIGRRWDARRAERDSIPIHPSLRTS